VFDQHQTAIECSGHHDGLVGFDASKMMYNRSIDCTPSAVHLMGCRKSGGDQAAQDEKWAHG
jgi:hypothetical protein